MKIIYVFIGAVYFINFTTKINILLKKLLPLLILLTSISIFAHNEGENKGDKIFPFIENKGQWHENVIYKSKVYGATVFYEKSAFQYQFIETPKHPHSNGSVDTKGHVFRAEFLGSNNNVIVSKEHQAPYYFNYFLGNNRSKWQSKVNSFSKIYYKNIYSKIDLKVYQSQSSIKYDYIVNPGGDYQNIKVQYKGAENPIINEGNLIIKHSIGNLVEVKPYAYQIINDSKIEVSCAYKLINENTVGYILPNGYNDKYPLIIDPTLIFSTYSGSLADNWGSTATYDSQGNGYAAGNVFSNGYITTVGAYDSTFQGGDVDITISKYSPDGSSLIYGTYIGGSENETVHSLVADDSSNIYFMGSTSSSDFPTSVNCFDSTKSISRSFNNGIGFSFSGGTDIIVVKISTNGDSLLGSSYYGGDDTDGVNFDENANTLINRDLIYNYGDQFRGEIVLDSLGNCYIGTCTWSSNLDSLNAVNTNSGDQDGLVIKFNNDLSDVLWSRHIGGSLKDAIYSLKVTSDNKVLVGGGTVSFNDFPVTSNAYISSAPGGEADGFIALISGDGDSLLYSTFIGTSDYDQVYFIDYDRFGGIYAMGQSRGGQFPVINAQTSNFGAGQFIIKLDSTLSTVDFSTVFGNGLGSGELNISPTAFLVDRCQNLYVSGWGGDIQPGEGTKTLPSAMPLTADAYSQVTDGNDFYLYALSRDADSLLFASFFGGTNSRDHVDGGTSRFDKEGVIYHSACASCGGSVSQLNDFPTTTNAFSSSKGTGTGGYGCNNAIFKYDFEILPKAAFTVSKIRGCAPYLARIVDQSVKAAEVIWKLENSRIFFSTDTVILFDTPGTYTIKQIARDTICNSIDSMELTIEVYPNEIELNTSSDTTVCNQDTINLFAYNNQTAKEFYWSTNNQFSDTLNNKNDSILSIKPDTILTTYYVMVTDSATNDCERIDSIDVVYTPVKVNFTFSSDTICEGTSLVLNGTFNNVTSFKWDFGNGKLDSVSTSPTTSYDQAGDYPISIYFSNAACMFNDTLDSTIHVRSNNLQLSQLKDTIHCGPDTLILTENSFGTANQFLWSSNSNFSDTLNLFPDDSSISIFNNTSQDYYIKITDKYCELEDTLFIEYNQFQLDLNYQTDSGCTPYPIQLNPTLTGTTSYQVDFGDGNTSTNVAAPSNTYLDSGLYIITLIGRNSRCQVEDTLRDSIRIFRNVQLVPLSDTMICLGDTIQISGNSSGTAKRFIWADNSNFLNPINAPQDSAIRVSPQAPQNTFYLRGENEICFDEIDVKVDVENLVVETDDILSICLGDTLEVNADVINSTSQLNFNWQPADSIIQGQASTTILTAPKGTMWFELLTTSSTGCEDFDSSLVEVAVPTFDSVTIFAEVDSAYRGQQIALSTDRNGSNLIYQWEPAELMDNPNSPNPTITIQNTTIVTVSVIDINTGCEVFAEKRLKVYEINCAEPDIFIPTAFTPNGDNNNDVFYVRGSNLYSIELEIYNRWGELVFETDNLNQGWDGNYQGREADPGVFVYHLKAICLDKQEYFTKGNITLIR